MRKFHRYLFLILFCSVSSHAMIDGLSFSSIRDISENFISKEESISLRFDPKIWQKMSSLDTEDLLIGFRNKVKNNLQFSIQVDHLERFPSESPNLKKYIHYYARRLPRAGVQINSDIENSIKDYYSQLEMEIPEQKKWVFQSLIWHPSNKVYIFSCKDGIQEKKEESKRSCNELLQSLKWDAIEN